MSFESRIKDMLLAVGADYKQIRTWLFGSSTGTPATLSTTNKTSLVAAINEVNAKPSYSPVDATTSQKGVVQLASLPEMATGVDPNKVATAQGVRQETEAMKNQILGGVGPAFDTLLELSQQDAADQTALLAAIGNPEADLAAYYTAAKQ